MSLIVAARFNTFEQAEAAASALAKEGVTPDSLHTFYVNPAGAHAEYPTGGDQAADPEAKGGVWGAIGGAAAVGVVGAIVGFAVTFSFTDSLIPVVAGAGVGAYVGSLMGATYALGPAKKRTRHVPPTAREKRERGRHAGVLLAVHTTPDAAARIAQILRNAGGVEVERAEGRWENGQWQDFNPLVGPNVTNK